MEPGWPKTGDSTDAGVPLTQSVVWDTLTQMWSFELSIRVTEAGPVPVCAKAERRSTRETQHYLYKS